MVDTDTIAKLIKALSPGPKRALAILGETASEQEMAFVGRHVGRALLKAYERVLDSRADRREAADK